MKRGSVSTTSMLGAEARREAGFCPGVELEVVVPASAPGTRHAKHVGRRRLTLWLSSTWRRGGNRSARHRPQLSQGPWRASAEGGRRDATGRSSGRWPLAGGDRLTRPVLSGRRPGAGCESRVIYSAGRPPWCCAASAAQSVRRPPVYDGGHDATRARLDQVADVFIDLPGTPGSPLVAKGVVAQGQQPMGDGHVRELRSL